MTQGIEFLETIYGQLHEARIVRSKGEFSERLLGKSPSYLTSMRAKQRVVSSSVVMGLSDSLMAEITSLGSCTTHAENRAILRRALAQVNNYLADQTVPAGVPASEMTPPFPRQNWLSSLFRMIVGVSV
ncbi:MAG: hypothetical protein IR164_07660 [Devosia sp.]|uniref:DUF6626 family protein n=1 Tax=Devosia sp. TaxID=1871048 RepID=UPI001A076669|nr:DUF6626 family protein [Devosia sp.]MBF0678798.1 hypothetical protein [Devosia sp.]